MKQHIKIGEAIKDLGIDKFYKLSDWLEEKKYIRNSSSICITIGQMIEFLDEKDKLSKIESPKNWIEEGQWTVWDGIAFIDGDELCDTLWEAVKEVL